MKLQPIVPFEPIPDAEIPSGVNWIHQVKWDGVRILTYYDGHDLRLFNRRKNERTKNYPELGTICDHTKANSLILDGEVIALDAQGRPSFHEVMKRDSARNQSRIQVLEYAVPVFYMVFDLIFCNGNWVHGRSLYERAELLRKWLPVSDRVQLVPVFQNGKSLFTSVQTQHMEGIVSKKLDSAYLINGKNENWRKIKVTRDLTAIVGGVTFRAGTVNALLLGLYDSGGQLVYIGHAGTGKLTQDDWHLVTVLARRLKRDDNPFVNQVDRSEEAQWLQLQLTVKIVFQEWTAGGMLRQPSIQAFVRINPKQCTIEEMNE
ncbi:DNA ligase [Sporolactobacillus shoreicorticis]|uniref:DNA ligase (ATP) n=1 Tax=Sporolactobacillus shoreicorticis TaxID=1923877 RepID=A0ABW5S183_9BACL|nr:RNA ligase family protein [Sporolactobacillus shoreicorticis]MCO7124746.1 DNA ligase [Sporolactobacillus shoreicorticis]